jgi:uncharacterized protein
MAVVWLLAAVPCLVAERQKPAASPTEGYKPTGYVNDFAGMVDATSREQIEAACKELDAQKRVQMVIVTVGSLDGMPIKEFSTQLFNQWGVGYKDTNLGVMVLLAKKEKQWRVTTGYGLESILTNEDAERLGAKMTGDLRKGLYGAALVVEARAIRDELLVKVK